MTNPKSRNDVLDTLRTILNEDRAASYGDAKENFARIAKLWSAYLDVVPIDSKDVAVMMALVKVSRLAHSKEHDDSWLDRAGYAALGYECP